MVTPFDSMYNSLNRGRINKSLAFRKNNPGVCLTEDSAANISDSVIIGDVQQTISQSSCPTCDSTNVRVMKCQDSVCEGRFCELCNPNCRWTRTSLERFDSGIGRGPLCKKCLDVLSNKEKKRILLLEEEKAKKTQIENQKNLAEKKKQFAALKKSAAEDEKRQNKIDQAIAVFGIPILLWFMGSTTFIIPYGTFTGFLYISCLWIIAISLEVSLLMRAFGNKGPLRRIS